MILKRLWVGMKTYDRKDSGTNDKIVLIINDDGVDRLHHTFPKINQDDQKQGAANVYEVIVPDTITAHNIDPDKLTNSSIRVAIRGKDLWRPRDFVILGEVQNGEVIPLASERTFGPPVKDPIVFGDPTPTEHSGFNGDLSGDEREGAISFPLRRVNIPFSPYHSPLPELGGFTIMATTADVKHAGTSNFVKLTIRYAGEYIIELTISPGGRNKAVFADGPTLRQTGAPGLTKDNIDSIELGIEGNNAWLPGSLFLLAAAEKGKSVMPLVHIPEWDPDAMGWLSTDPSDANSRPSISLPRAMVFDRPDVFQPVPPGEVAVGLKMTTANGRTQVTMDFPELKSQ
jgi:hypothetical protein